jgi:NaMN:DMB phosphoribosyltransferase
VCWSTRRPRIHGQTVRIVQGSAGSLRGCPEMSTVAKVLEAGGGADPRLRDVVTILACVGDEDVK